MSDRLPSQILVGALLRRVNDAGGIGAVLAKGDPQAGAILVVTCEKGRNFKVVERGLTATGETGLVTAGPGMSQNSADIDAYWRQRRARDPDLWVVEVDIAAAERFAAETIIAG
ncbi:MAG: hypothetical protein B7Y43_00625 [Sphingomonas sp. 28-62-20]|uniref:DUF1491 family protein n=1 Tax=Sphingomonas sp. 28-62-20 TaxID=1970433 RepID=UPI000BDA4D13|nr:MAG: hypothetical protein B7Y43_00625 [Sphingomonas sp. 28-62-20]